MCLRNRLVARRDAYARSWEIGRNLLMRHRAFCAQLGKYRRKIMLGQLTLNQRVLGSSPSTPTINSKGYANTVENARRTCDTPKCRNRSVAGCGCG